MSHAAHIHTHPQLHRQLGDLVHALSNASAIAFICDTNTYAAGGEALHRALPATTKLLNQGLQVKPTLVRAQLVAQQLTDVSCAVVFGSGTLTDIAKYAAFSAGVPLISIPSAPSMNGYASATASLIDAEGKKSSYHACPPEHILLDESLYAHAQLALVQAGMGDTLCRTSVQADALLAHLLTGSWYDEEYFEQLRELELLLLRDLHWLQKRDHAYLRLLMQALLLSGEAMRKAGCSIPASGSEHMIAHQLECRYPLRMQPHYHGAQIAVTCLTTMRVQQFMIKKPAEFNIPHYVQTLHQIADHREALPKLTQLQSLSAQQFQHAWQTLQEAMPHWMLEADILQYSLQSAGLATDPEGLGIVKADYIDTVRTAFASRNRITFLDLVAMRSL